ncbi:MAG: class D sortase [Coriobacteriia bacterium]|nr:class D sortase [Coriobacteriia bacterium]
MTRPRISRGTSRVLGGVSLALLVLGIACIAWAAANLLGGAGPATDIASDQSGAVASSSTVVASGTPSTDTTTVSASPASGAVMGTLTIPALKQRFPVIQGTGDAELKRGVGHLTQTALPGESDNCVLSGHRDTVFTRLGRLKIGDMLIVETAAGSFTYKIRRIRIVHKNDRTVVVPTDHAVLTVSTCYPFRYVGAAPDRYVLIADMVAGP